MVVDSYRWTSEGQKADTLKAPHIIQSCKYVLYVVTPTHNTVLHACMWLRPQANTCIITYINNKRHCIQFTTPLLVN